MSQTSNSFSYDYKPSLLEKWGVRYFEYLGQKFGTNTLSNLKIDELPPDAVLQSLSSNITGFAAIVAFGIGAITTFVTIWFEWTFKTVLPTTEYYFLYILILLIMLALEFSVLFWLGLRTVYSLSCLTGQYQSNTDHLLPIEYSTSTILARAAMELPDPVVHYLGIDPLKHLSKSKLFMIAILYKAKVVLSSLIAKIIFLVKAAQELHLAGLLYPLQDCGMLSPFTKLLKMQDYGCLVINWQNTLLQKY